MKLLLVLFLTVVTAVISAKFKTEDDKEKFRKQTLECGQELSIEPNDLELVMKEPVGHSEQKNCLLKCIFRKVGFINDFGKVQLRNYHEIIPYHGLMARIMEECQHVVVETCKDVLTLIKCRDDVIKTKLNSILFN